MTKHDLFSSRYNCPLCGSAETWFTAHYTNSDYPGVILDGFKCECGNEFLDTAPMLQGDEEPTDEPHGSRTSGNPDLGEVSGDRP